jgi:hypothetical protein
VKTIPIAAAGAAMLLMSGAAAAQSAADVKCLLLSNAFANASKDPNAKKAAEASGYFYLGRIGEHATAAQLKPLMDQQAKSLTNETAGAQMQACVKALEDKVTLLQSLAPPAPQPAAKPAPQPQGR